MNRAHLKPGGRRLERLEIVVAPTRVVPDVEKVFADEESVRRLIARVGPPAQLRAPL